MTSWWSRNLWKIFLFPTLAAVGVGGVAFFYAYLHNLAGFDKDGKPITTQQTSTPVTATTVNTTSVPRAPLGEIGGLAPVVDDLTRAGPETARHYRYLSLVHRHDDPTADPAQFERDRQAIVELAAALSPPNTTAAVVALDAGGTVFRLDLRQLDWSAENWREATRGYPYGLKFGAVDDPLLADVARKLAALTEERLPIVRMDWWVSALTRPPLTEPGGLGLTSKSPPPAVKATAEAHRNRAVSLAVAARELRATEAEVKKMIEADVGMQVDFGLAPLLRAGGSLPRDAWESSERNAVSAFQELARRLKRGSPVVNR